MERSRIERALAMTLIASIGLHVLLVLVLPRTEVVHVTAEAPAFDDIELYEEPVEPLIASQEAVDVTDPDPDPRTDLPPPDARVAPTPERPDISPSDTRVAVPEVRPSAGPERTDEPTVLTVEGGDRTHTGAPPTGPVSLDPRSVARTELDRGSGPTAIRPQAQDGPGESTAERDARIGRELDDHLRAFANFQSHLTQRPTPEPRTLPDGRIAFEGIGLTMIFDPRTGDVGFNDRGNVQYQGFGSASSGRQGFTMSFDANDAMYRRRGADPRAAERRWLLNRTQALREQAQDRAMQSQGESTARGLRGRLQRMLEDETKPIEARRARIFRLWDQCSEEESGQSARASILGFVRERLPAGSADAYGAAELARLNSGRRSNESFAPY